MYKIEFGWIPTNEATERTGISSRDLTRHAMDERLHPTVIEGDNYWNIDELDDLTQRIADEDL